VQSLSLSHQHNLRFTASREAFEQAFSAFRMALGSCALQGRVRYYAELAFEEVVSNIMRHGGAEGRQPDVAITVAAGPQAVVLTFEDDGAPFDPLSRPAPARPASLEEAPLGGLGLLLLRKTSTHLHYTRTADAKNRLTVTIATS
jgi:anti-sigma regulatory factor (Ser/Thr protein kinase)